WVVNKSAGPQIAPLAGAVEHRETVGKVWRDCLGHKLRPLGLGQRLLPCDAAAEEQFRDQHPLLKRKRARIGRRLLRRRCRTARKGSQRQYPGQSAAARRSPIAEKITLQ